MVYDHLGLVQMQRVLTALVTCIKAVSCLVSQDLYAAYLGSASYPDSAVGFELGFVAEVEHTC